jgi:hypothetical protein
VAPSNAFSVTTQGHAMTSGLAGVVFPVAVNPARPSPPLPRHAEHCDDISTLLECTRTRRRHDCHCAAYGPPVDGTLESARGGGRTTNHYAATLEAAPVRAKDAS